MRLWLMNRHTVNYMVLKNVIPDANQAQIGQVKLCIIPESLEILEIPIDFIPVNTWAGMTIWKIYFIFLYNIIFNFTNVLNTHLMYRDLLVKPV
jgi:hypothetical protein